MHRQKSPQQSRFVPGGLFGDVEPAQPNIQPGAREATNSLLARSQPVEVDPQPASLWSKAVSTNRVSPRLARIFNTYVRARVLPQGSTFDDIARANQRMDLSEFSQMAVDYGFVPELPGCGQSV